ncbi:MAG: response regulator [Deltaproteobacteria bacterium]|nr:response regulator [Deltaproteobacteria bacterium]
MRKRSISSDLTISLISVVIITSIVVLFVNYYFISAKIKSELLAKANEYAGSLADTLSVPLWNYDTKNIESIGRTFAQNDLVVGLTIEDNFGKTLFKSLRRDLGQVIGKKVDIYYEGQSLGWVDIRLSSRHYENINSQLLMFGLMTMVTVVLAMLGATGLLLRKLLKNPIDELVMGIEKIADGDYHYRLGFTNKAEIELIGSKFSYMADQIRLRELNLAAERERLEVTLRSIGDAVIVTDVAGQITLVNQKAEELFRWSQREVVGEDLTEMLRFPDLSTRDVYIQLLKDVLQAGTPRRLETNIIMIDKPHSECIVSGSAAPILIGRDTISGGIFVFRDVTKEETLEKRLRQSQKMEAMGTLAGGIAHDFNNILAAIIGYTELTLRNTPEEHANWKKLSQILKAGMRAKDLVRQILTFSRRTEQEKTPLRIGSIIQEVLKLMRASLPATIEIRQSLAVPADTVLADPTQIHQVMLNLCTNAAHAMREKGGVLEVILSNLVIDQYSATRYPELTTGHYLKITVSDTGTGMDKATQERIYDPFFTTKAPGEGTGMGLSVVHGIVTSHKGLITAYSEPGKGSTFHIFLPLVDMACDNGRQPDIIIPLGAGEHVLLVDDEEMIVDIWKAMLENIGYRVTATTLSAEALTIFRDQPEAFDLIITDQTMPHLTGIELTREIVKIRSDIPIILCTGFSEAVTREKIKEIGIRELVMKPIITTEIAQVIKRCLEKCE